MLLLDGAVHLLDGAVHFLDGAVHLLDGGILLCQLFVAHQYLCVALLDGGEILVLHVHPVTHVRIGSSLRQTMQDALHVGITAIDAVIQLQDTIVVSIATCLVEDAQHHVKTVVDLAMKTWNLNNNAVVRQAIDERVGQTFRHHMIVVVSYSSVLTCYLAAKLRKIIHSAK